MTGLAIHEILGFVFFIPIIIHLLIAWPWIQKTTRKFFITVTRTRVNFLLNSILFILVITELFSGLLISEVVMPTVGIKAINDRSWRAVHNQTLNFTLFFAGLHIAINWGWIASVFKKRSRTPKNNNKFLSIKIVPIIVRIGIIVLAAGLISIALYSIIGAPSLANMYRQNEIARFSPSPGHGLGQFFGETFLIAVVVFIARKWLRLRI
jgi:uncharacterized protein DUF4405